MATHSLRVSPTHGSSPPEVSEAVVVSTLLAVLSVVGSSLVAVVDDVSVDDALVDALVDAVALPALVDDAELEALVADPLLDSLLVPLPSGSPSAAGQAVDTSNNARHVNRCMARTMSGRDIGRWTNRARRPITQGNAVHAGHRRGVAW